MLITSSNLSALFISFSKNFEDAYFSEPAPLLDNIASNIPSNTRDQRYPFVQALSGAMRQWVGERQTQNVVVDGFVVTNLRYENTLAIQVDDLMDDQYSVYSNMLIPNLARHAKLLPDQQIANVINGNQVGFDGVTFFNSAHPIDPSGLTTGTQSNIVTTNPLNATGLAKAQAVMMGLKGPDGLPMGSYGNVILVPPSLKFAADTIANSSYFPINQNGQTGVFGSASNVFQGQYTVVASPWITDTGDPTTAAWYLLDCRNKQLCPFFWQMRMAPQLVQLVNPDNSLVFMQDRIYMGVKMRGAAAPSLWFKAVKSTT